MVRDDLFAYSQAKAISLSSLGCKEGIKNLREVFLAYATAGIRNRKYKSHSASRPIGSFSRPDQKTASILRHRIDRISNQVV
jgi:hypothetical protein